MPNTIRLRYPGRCDGCDRELSRGSRAYRDAETKTLRCLDCRPNASTASTAAGIAGHSAEQEASRATGQAAKLADRQAAAERRAAAFAAGAEGERIAAAELAPLSAAGYVLLHDRAAGGNANLDHLVVGPTGVWLVNAKHWTGQITTGDTLRRNGRSCHKQLERAAAERRLVAEALTAASVRAPVRSAFAFTSAAPDRARIDNVELVPVAQLRQTVTAGVDLVDGATVDQAVAAIVAAFARAGETPRPPAAPEGDLPEDLRDDDWYVFVEPWSKYGKPRLYVHRCGLDFGYVDLSTRTIHPNADHQRLDATMTLVLEWFADAGAEPVQVGRLGRLARWHRTAGLRRRVVAVRFLRSGTDRLYVHLCDGASREQIGYYDRRAGTVHAAEPEFAPVIARAAALHPVQP